MQKMIIVFLTLIALSSKLQSQNETYQPQYPYLADILDLYYSYYLSPPKNTKALVAFAKEISKDGLTDFTYYDILQSYTFSNLSNNKQIRFEPTVCGFRVFEHNNVIYENMDSPCCDLISKYNEEERSVYLKNKQKKAYFFANKKAIIKVDTILSQYLICKKHFDSFYTFDKTNITIVAFDGRMRSYCGDSKRIKSPYFVKLKRVLKEFLSTHDLNKIIFYTYWPIE